MRALRFTEKIMAVLAVIGVIMKFTNDTGGEWFILFGLSCLSLLYFFGGFFIFNEPGSRVNTAALSLTAGIGFSIASVGIALKLLYWPGSSVILLAGIIFIVPILLLAVSNKQKQENNPAVYVYFHNMINRCFIMLLFSCFFFLIPQSVLIRFQYRDNPVRAQQIINLLEEAW